MRVGRGDVTAILSGSGPQKTDLEERGKNERKVEGVIQVGVVL